MSLSGVKRTWPIAVQISANDPKRTLGLIAVWASYAAFLRASRLRSVARLWASRGPSRRAHATARVHYTSRRHRNGLAARRSRTAGRARSADRRAHAIH